MIVVSKKLLTNKTIKIVLDDAGYSSRIPTEFRTVQHLPSVMNDHVVTSSDGVQPVANMTKDQILRAGLQTEGTRTRVCMTYAFWGLIAITMTADANSAPPIVADLVPVHNQTIEFDKKSGSTQIDKRKKFAKPLISESLRNRQAMFIDGFITSGLTLLLH